MKSIFETPIVEIILLTNDVITESIPEEEEDNIITPPIPLF